MVSGERELLVVLMLVELFMKTATLAVSLMLLVFQYVKYY
jgi:hypothetical protein